MAALDPQPLPGLVALLLLCLVYLAPMVAAVSFAQKGFIDTSLKNKMDREFIVVKAKVADKSELKRLLKIRLFVLASAGIFRCALFSALLFVGFTLQNEATKVWRISQANIEIVAFSTTEQGLRDLRE